MKFLLLTVGARGDVQPFISLGEGLRAAGHQVTLLTHKRYRAFILQRGLEFAPLGDESLKFINGGAVEERPDQDQGFLGRYRNQRRLKRQFRSLLREILNDEWAAAQAVEPEAIIYHPRAYGGYHLAEKLAIPGFLATFYPSFVPTTDFASPFAPRWPLGGWYNRLSYNLVTQISKHSASIINRWRTEALELPPRSLANARLIAPDGRPVPALHAYSRQVIPQPTDWPTSSVTTGYWFLDLASNWQPAAELTAFLEAGPAPVYIGFGSMAGSRPESWGRTVLEALIRSGQRGIFALGWGGLTASNLPENIFQVDEVPHDWLFPRVAAVVHHGGAGTTAAVLRAGKPNVIVPFCGDQPFWASRVYHLGVSPPPLPKKKLTADRLAEAIRMAVGESSISQQAAEVGALIQAENGVNNACEFIHRQLGI